MYRKICNFSLIFQVLQIIIQYSKWTAYFHTAISNSSLKKFVKMQLVFGQQNKSNCEKNCVQKSRLHTSKVGFLKLSKMEKQVKLAAVYTAERFALQGNFFGPQNPRFIFKSGFKSRAGYNGARMVIFIGMKQNKIKMANSKKERFSTPPILQYVFCYQNCSDLL